MDGCGVVAEIGTRKGNGGKGVAARRGALLLRRSCRIAATAGGRSGRIRVDATFFVFFGPERSRDDIKQIGQLVGSHQTKDGEATRFFGLETRGAEEKVVPGNDTARCRRDNLRDIGLEKDFLVIHFECCIRRATIGR